MIFQGCALLAKKTLNFGLFWPFLAILSRSYALFGAPFTGHKMRWCPKIDKYHYGGGSQSMPLTEKQIFRVNYHFVCDVFFNAILLLLLRQRAFISLNDTLACDGCQYRHAMSFIVVWGPIQPQTLPSTDIITTNAPSCVCSCTTLLLSQSLHTTSSRLKWDTYS